MFRRLGWVMNTEGGVDEGFLSSLQTQAEGWRDVMFSSAEYEMVEGESLTEVDFTCKSRYGHQRAVAH